MHLNQLYETVTNRIVAELEEGAAPWLKPWRTGKRTATGLIPRNGATGREYRGINIPILWDAAETGGYPTHAWMTFRQAFEQGARVRRGERGTHVVFAKRLADESGDESAEEGEGPSKPRTILRTYTVFNVAQIDNLAALEDLVPEGLPEDGALRAASKFIAATHADVHLGGNLACYYPVPDYIQLPLPSAFKSPESFFATGLHELGHWSGNPKRLARDLTGRFGSEAYAAEELVAELTAAFLCAHLGVTGELRHAGYIENWIALLRNDKRAIFAAAAKAGQAADYLRHLAERREAREGASGART